MKSIRFAIALLGASFLSILSGARGVTLGTLLQIALEKNPAIQQAKAHLEEAAGQGLVLRAIIGADANLRVPAGVQGGHRAGESGTKGFGFVGGSFTQAVFNAAIPPSRLRGDVEVLIA